MTRLNKFLAGLLAIQLVLAIVVLSRSGDSMAIAKQPVLPGFDAATATRLQIFESGAAKPSVDLVKRGSAWVLASHWDYPVDPAKIDAALGSLTKMTAGDPIATSASRHEQQKVADTVFERKLVVTGGKDTTLFIGSTKGRRTSVRLGGEDRVLGAAGVSVPSVGPRDWIASSYSEIPRDDIDKITIQRGATTIELDRAQTAPGSSGSAGSGAAPERTWRLALDGTPITLAAGEKLDSVAIETIVSAVASVDAMPADPKRDISKPAATVTVTKKGGATVVFDVVADGQLSWVKQRGSERATSVDKTRLESLMTAERGTLVSRPEPVPSAGNGSAAKPLPVPSP